MVKFYTEKAEDFKSNRISDMAAEGIKFMNFKLNFHGLSSLKLLHKSFFHLHSFFQFSLKYCKSSEKLRFSWNETKYALNNNFIMHEKLIAMN